MSESRFKYPFIPKEYYAAVMFVCKMIHENLQFNKAIKISASYYDVDKDVLAKHVRARQAAGQKGKKRGKYKYYIVRTTQYSDAHGLEYTGHKIVKATSAKNAEHQVFEYQMSDSVYSTTFGGEVVAEYETRDEAEYGFSNLCKEGEQE